jgi:Domain of unknown function (DUF4184)
MPLTLPTHPLAVLPLKFWRPHRFDGVALAVGSIAPDVPYALEGYLHIHSHAWHAALWWAVPVTLAGTRLVRWAAPTVAAHLPSVGPLALRDYGVLGAVRYRWWVTSLCGMLGALSHLVWDAFTHPRIDGGRLPIPVLYQDAMPGVPWWYLLVNVSDMLGFVIGAILAVHIGQSHLLLAWHGPARLPAAAPVRFWGAVVLTFALGVAPLPWQPLWYPGQAIWTMLAIGAALLAGTATVKLTASAGAERASGEPEPARGVVPADRA